MNQQFHINYYNFRIERIEWDSPDVGFVKTLTNSTGVDEEKGDPVSLVRRNESRGPRRRLNQLYNRKPTLRDRKRIVH